MLSYVFSSMMEISLSVSVLILFFMFCIPKRLMNYSPKCRSVLWLILAVRLLIPIQPRFRTAAVHFTAPYHLIALPSGSGAQEVSYSFMQIAAAIWLVGAVLFFAFHIISYKCFEEKLRRGQKTADLTEEEKTEISNLFYETKYAMGNYNPVELWISSKAPEPMMIGFFHPKIVVPDCMTDESKLSMIFRHELTHYQRKDEWYRFIMLLTLSAHWFNPVVYLMTRRSTEDIEGACDLCVIAGQDKKFVQDYIYALLDTAKCLLKKKNPAGQTALISYFSSSASKLKVRFSELLSPKKKSGRPLLGICAVIVVFETCFVFIQSNDQNLEWAENLKEGDISYVEFSDVGFSKQDIFSISDSAKRDVIHWFGENSFKPVFYPKKNRTEQGRFCIAKKDGTQKTVSIFSDGSVRVGGKEYRAYQLRFGNNFAGNLKIDR